MVLPLIGMGIAAAGSIAGGMMGSRAQAGATQAQLDMHGQNMQQSLAERMERAAIVDQLMRQQNAAQITARGDRSEYIPGIGYVATPSESTRGLISASDAEERQRLTGDAVSARDEANRNRDRRSEEGTLADVLLRALALGPRHQASDIEGVIGNQDVTALNRGHDESENTLITSLMRRSGGETPALGRILERGGTARAEQLKNALGNARLQALQLTPQLNAQEQGNTANLYNLLAGRASGAPGMQFNPTGAGGDITGAAMRSQAVAPQAYGAAINGLGSGPRTDPGLMQPNFGPAHTIGAASSIIGGGLQNFATQQQLASMLQGGAGAQNRQAGSRGVFS